MGAVLEVVIIGVLLVFLILLLITFLMMVFPYLLGERKKTKTQAEENIQSSTVETVAEISNADISDDYTLISVITAAIAAYREANGEGANSSDFRVVAFRKTGSYRNM